MSCFKENKLEKCFVRFSPLFFALWMAADIVLDVNQTITYHKYAYDNGTYRKWAVIQANMTGTDYHETVSPNYFICAVATLALPPVLGWAYFVLLRGRPMMVDLFQKKFDPSWTATNALLIIPLLPFDIILLVLWIYIAIPLFFLRNGLATAVGFKEHESDGEDPINIFILVEHLLEAIPHLILASIFTANNSTFLLETEFLPGVNEFSICVISVIFSAVSILQGIYMCCCKRCDDEEWYYS